MSSRAIRRFNSVAPTDYLALSVALASSTDEASRRSAVDRAYYAAFLATRDELAIKGYINVARNSNTHAQVADALRGIDKNANEMLFDLRRARNRLTYRTESATLPRGQSIPELLDSARAVIEAVRALPQNLS